MSDLKIFIVDGCIVRSAFSIPIFAGLRLAAAGTNYFEIACL